MSLTSQIQMMIRRAKQLQRTLGDRCAAGYLRNREVPFSHAVIVLTGRPERFTHLAVRAS